MSPINSSCITTPPCLENEENESSPLLRMKNRHQKENDEIEQTRTSSTSSTPRLFIFFCISMACRAFEAGIISSMIPEIKHELNFDYKTEGIVAASPDYGIVPGGIMAIFAFQCFPAYNCLVVVMFGTSLATFACAVRPSKDNLIMARAVGGFFWAHAATLYPVWIDQYGGSTERRTMWLAGMNVSLLVGILTGYIVGGICQSSSSITWVELYFGEGCLMAICGAILLTCFDKKLIQINCKKSESTCQASVKNEEEQILQGPSILSTQTISEELQPSVWELLSMLPNCMPFVLAVSILAITAGCTCFALYFVTQVCHARGFGHQEAMIVVASVFTTAPILGMVSGSWITAKLGGYSHHTSTFRVALVAAIGTLLSAISFVFSRSMILNKSNSHIPFIVASWLFFFFGATPASTLNGVVVSAVPMGAAHVASGIQFAFINSAKIFIPPIGGMIVDQMGLITGFDMTTITCSMAFVVLGIAGVIHTKSSSPTSSNLPQGVPPMRGGASVCVDGYNQIP